MPTYYFDIFNGVTALDDEGAVLADFDAAQAYAIKGARSLVASTVLEGHLTLSHRIEIKDEAHHKVGTVTFGEAVAVQP